MHLPCLSSSAPGRVVLGALPPPPPPSRNRLAQEPPPGSAVEFSHHFFYDGIGFFMVLVDVGQLFRCAGHHFMCVATGPPIRGDPISQSQRAGKFFFRGTGLPTVMRKNQSLVPRSNFVGKTCARTAPWFRGQTLPVPGHRAGGCNVCVCVSVFYPCPSSCPCICRSHSHNSPSVVSTYFREMAHDHLTVGDGPWHVGGLQSADDGGVAVPVRAPAPGARCAYRTGTSGPHRGWVASHCAPYCIQSATGG